MNKFKFKFISCIMSFIMLFSTFAIRVNAAEDVSADINRNKSIAYTYPGKLQLPTNIKTEITNSSVIITWDKTKDASRYDIEIDGSKIISLSDTKYIDENLGQKSNHQYRIKSKNITGSSEWSNIINVTTLPNSPKLPTSIDIRTTTDSVMLNWNIAEEINNVEIEADGKIIENGTSTSFQQNGLKPGTVHNYRIKMDNAGGSSGWSNIIKAKTYMRVPISNYSNKQVIPNNLVKKSSNTLGLLQKVVSIPTLDSIILTWTPVEGASGYDIEVDGKIVNNGSKTTFIHNNLQSDSKHTYRVRAKNEKIVGDWSNIVTGSTLKSNDVKPKSPSDKNGVGKVDSTPENNNTTSTQSVPGNAAPDSSTGSSMTQNASTNMNTSSMKLQAYIVSPDTESPTAPTSLAASSVTCTAMNLIWTASTDNVGVTEYDIYNGAVQIGSTTGDTTFSITGLVPNTAYNFTVVAKDAAGNVSLSSDVLSITTAADVEPPTAPVSLTASSVTFTTMTLSWTASTDNIGVTEYDIYNGATQIGSTTGDTTFNVTGLKINTTYNFTVVAKDAAGNVSLSSDVLSVTTAADTESPTAPTNLAASTVTCNAMNLTWTGSIDNIGVTEYDVYNGAAQIGSTTGDTTFNVTGLMPNTNYNFTVVAKDAAGNSSLASNVLSVTTAADTESPTAPANLGASAVTYTTMTLTWTSSTDNIGVTEYNIYSGSTQIGSTTGDTTFNVTGLKINTTYNFTVIAKDAAGNSSIVSSALSVTTAADTESPTAPANLTASSVTFTTMTLSWAASTDNIGVTEYDIYNGAAQIGSTTGDTTFNVTGLKINTTYNFTVIAKDAAGNSSIASSALSVTTAADTEAPTAPANLTASSVTYTTMTLSWTASTDNIGVTEYDIYNGATQIGSTTGTTTLNITGLVPNTTYNLTVVAKDAAGNLSLASSALSVTTAADTESPTTPTNLAASSITCVALTLTWTASTDNAGIKEYEIYNGVTMVGSTTSTTFRIKGLEANTTYSFTVIAKDVAENVSAASTILTVTTSIPSSITISSNLTISEDNIYKDITLTGGTLDLNGHNITLTGKLTQTGGTLYVHNGQLNIEGDYLIDNNGSYSNGTLEMINNLDYIKVGGNFLMHSYYSHSYYLTAGVLEVKGNFTQIHYNSTDNFKASGSHKVILSGTGDQTVSFDSPGGSCFNILQVNNSNIIFSSPAVINTLVSDNDIFINSSLTIVNILSPLVNNLYINGNLTLQGGTIDLGGKTIYVSGSLIQTGGTLFVDSGQLIIEGDYLIDNNGSYSNGTLKMIYNADYIKVGGNFLMHSYYSHNGLLTAGVLEVKENFTQIYYTYSDNFKASGSHKVILSGAGVQTVSFNTPGSSCFNILEVNNSNNGIVCSTPLTIKSPLVNNFSIFGNLTIQGDTLDLGGKTLTITGSLIQTGGTLFVDNGQLIIEGDYLTLKGGTLDLGGKTIYVSGSLIQTGGTLFVDNGQLIIERDYLIDNNGSYSNGLLKMINDADYIKVGGNFLMHSTNSHNGLLTAGVLEIKGNFTQIHYNYSDNFKASGSHKVILSGAGVQTVSFDTPSSSCFNILQVSNSSNGIVCSTPLTIKSPLVNNFSIFGNLTIQGDTLDLGGKTLTITGSLIQTGGTLLVDNGQLIIEGDYLIDNNGSYSNGLLKMINDADYIKVGGNFLMHSTNSHNGLLTAGVLEIKGNFTQVHYNYSDNFKASGSHKVILSGAGVQTVSFDTPNYSCFNIFQVNNSSNGIVCSSPIVIKSPLVNNFSIFGNLTIQGDTLDLGGKTLTVTGSLIQTGGTLFVDNGQLIIEGDYLIDNNGSYSLGLLKMINDVDYIKVGGNFLMHSTNSHNGLLTAGVLEVKGNFTQTYYNYQDNFKASGSHKVILSGEGIQTVSFNTPSSSCFNILEVNNSNIIFYSPLVINTLVGDRVNDIFINSSLTIINIVSPLANNLYVNGNLTLQGGILDLAGHTINVTGNLIQTGGTLFIDGGQLNITGDYTISNGGNYSTCNAYLKMINNADYVTVGRNFFMQSTYSHDGYLTAGVLEVKGNFTQRFNITTNNNFNPSGEHKVILSGTGAQTVSFDSYIHSFFNILQVNNSNGVIFSSPIIINAPLVNNISINGNLTLPGGTLDLAGHTINVSGNLTQTGGTLFVDGGQLNITGDYTISNGGNYSYCYAYLKMTNNADYVSVGRNFLMQSSYSHDGYLTAGVLEVKGNFTQGFNVYTYNNFNPSGDHKVILSGTGVQTVSFSNSGSSCFNILQINNSNILFSSSVAINTLVSGNGNDIFLYSSLTIAKIVTPLAYNLYVNGNLTLQGGTLDLAGHTINVTGNLSQTGGTLFIDGGQLNITGDYTISNGGSYSYCYAYLKMTNSVDYVSVGGNFLMQSSYSQDGYLTAGVLEVKGNFTQSFNFNTYNNFNPNGDHIVLLSGNNLQTVYFYNSTYSRFNILVTTKPLDTGYSFNVKPVWNYLIENYKIEGNYGESTSGDGVYGPSGNFSKTFTDLTCGSGNSAVIITRTYNSRDSRTDTGFGKGWSFSYECSIKDFGGSIPSKSVRIPDGSTETFKVNADGTFTATDSRNQLILQSDGSYNLITKDQHIYGFNSSGYLVWIKDRTGNTTAIDVDNSGKVTGITDCVGRHYSVSYYSAGLIQAITDPSGRTVRYEYDNSELIKSYDPDNHATKYGYDSSGLLNSILDNDNNVIESVVYNHSGKDANKVYQTTDQYGNVSTYAYDNIHLKTTITDSNGRQTVQVYDNSFNIVSSTDAEGKITYYSYYTDSSGADTLGEVKTSTDRNGSVTSYTRDGAGNIIKITNHDGSHKDYIYDGKNNVIQETDESGKITFYIYDSDGVYLLKKIQPLNGTDIYSASADQSKFAITTYSYYSDAEAQSLGYGGKGLLKSITDPEGHVTTYTYDAFGNVKTITDAEYNTTSFDYNNIGWKTCITSPMGYKVNYSYNNSGSITKVILNGGEITRTTYDAEGRMTKEISANLYDPSLDNIVNDIYSGDCGTRYTYYGNGKVKTIKDAENNITTYTYDLYGNVLTETMPDGAVYSYDYDVMNRVIHEYYQQNSSSAKETLADYSYTILSGGKTQKQEKRYLNSTDTAVITSIYDYAGRLIEQDNPDSTKLITNYNANGTAANTTDARGSVTYYKYDYANRLTELWTPFENNIGTIYYSYTRIDYDKAGRKIDEIVGKDKVLLNSVPANAITTNYSYYNNNKLKTQTDSSGRRTDYFYDNDGYLSKQAVYVDAATQIIIEYSNNYFGKPDIKTIHIRRGDLYGNSSDDDSDAVLTTSYNYDKNGNLKTATTPDGVTTTYGYDKLNRLISVSHPGQDEFENSAVITTSQTLNYAGKVLTATDANNNTTIYEYDGKQNLIRITDAKGNVSAYYYDNAGRKIADVQPGDYISGSDLSTMNRTEYSYDLMGRLKTVTAKYYDTASSLWKSIVTKAYSYDANGNVTKELDALGYESGTGYTVDAIINSGYGTIITYNLANKPVTVQDADTRDRNLAFTTSYVYDGAGRKVSETNAAGTVTTYYYDDAGNVLQITIKKTAADPEKTIKSAAYDLAGNVISQTDGNGNVTTYEYNLFNKLRKVSYAGDSSIPAYIINYQYDVMGNLKQSSDSMGKINLYTYDNQNRVLATTEKATDGSSAITISTRYDKNGNKRFITDGNGNTSENTYDELNRLICTSITVTSINNDKTTKKITYGYDAKGNKTSETDWRGNTTQYTYDALSRLVQKIDAYGKTIQRNEYYDNGLQSKSYDALNNVTQYFYDKNNRLIKTIDPANGVTKQSYDNVGNIATKTDADNNVTKYAYDEFNNLISVINANNEITSYTYDINGNMLTETDGKGNTTTYEYNAANKVLSRIDNGGRSGNPGSYSYNDARTVSYTYNADGSLKTAADRNGLVLTYTYDIHGRKLSETVGTINICYTYDNNGNQLTISDSTGTTTRTYDELNRVTSKTVPSIGKSTYVYDIIAGIDAGMYGENSTDPFGNVTLKVYDKDGRLYKVTAAGLTTTYSYYDNGSLMTLTYADGSTENYTYYGNNLLNTLVNKKSDGTVIESYTYTYDAAKNMLTKVDGKGTTTYTYDKLNRLQTVTEPDGTVTTYTFDAAGNRLTETVKKGTDTTVTTYNYNDQNRLTDTTTKLNGTITQTAAYTYDNNGNELTVVTTPYVNGAAGTAETVTNVYDELNELIQSTNPDGSSIVNIYNGEGLRVAKATNGVIRRYLYEGDKVVLETDENGNLTATNVYGTNLISRTTGGQTGYYFYNGHADVTCIIGTDGTVLASYYYDEFGNLKESSGSFDNPFRYSGYQYDSETGTYYIMSRMYDPETGRFLQEDTYRGDTKDPLSLNLYTYTHNEPLMYSDPTGHFWKELWGGVQKAASYVADKVSELWDDVKETASDAFNATKSTISSIGKSISSGWKNVASKASSLSESANRKINQAKQTVSKAMSNLNKTLSKINVDKVKSGLGKVANGGFASALGYVALTTAATALTGGAALPFMLGAITGGAALLSMGTGASDVVEGVQDIYHGLKGENNSSVNLIRDYVFNGNQKNYEELEAGAQIVSAVGPMALEKGAALSGMFKRLVTEEDGYADLSMFTKGAGKAETKTLNEWLNDTPDLLDETKQWYNEKPEWWSIDPDNTEVYYRTKDEVDAIRKLPGESGGHHPHGLALGGPEGQELTITGETRTVKNPTHSQVTGLQRRVIREIKKNMER